MNEVSERYNTKVEIPISIILETIFSDDNKDVETLCRWAKHYGFVDLVKENEEDKLGYYKLQDDYTKQSFYVLLDKEERKQYDYEDFLLDKIEEKDKEIERLKEIAHKMHLWIFLHSGDEQKVYDELGLSDEENDILGYSGQFRIGSDKDVKD